MLLGEVVARIGCERAISKDHKNEWLQNWFNLKPAGRLQAPGNNRTHLVWRETDVEKAKRLWEARTVPATVRMNPLPEDPKDELAAMAEHGADWKPAFVAEAALEMLRTGLDLMNLAMGILKPEAAKAGAA